MTRVEEVTTTAAAASSGDALIGWLTPTAPLLASTVAGTAGAPAAAVGAACAGLRSLSNDATAVLGADADLGCEISPPCWVRDRVLVRVIVSPPGNGLSLEDKESRPAVSPHSTPQRSYCSRLALLTMDSLAVAQLLVEELGQGVGGPMLHVDRALDKQGGELDALSPHQLDHLVPVVAACGLHPVECIAD